MDNNNRGIIEEMRAIHTLYYATRNSEGKDKVEG